MLVLRAEGGGCEEAEWERAQTECFGIAERRQMQSIKHLSSGYFKTLLITQRLMIDGLFKLASIF